MQTISNVVTKITDFFNNIKVIIEEVINIFPLEITILLSTVFGLVLVLFIYRFIK